MAMSFTLVWVPIRTGVRLGGAAGAAGAAAAAGPPLAATGAAGAGAGWDEAGGALAGAQAASSTSVARQAASRGYPKRPMAYSSDANPRRARCAWWHSIAAAAPLANLDRAIAAAVT